MIQDFTNIKYSHKHKKHYEYIPKRDENPKVLQVL